MINLPGYMEYPLSSLETDEMVAIFKRYGDEALLFKPTKSTWGMSDDGAPTLNYRHGDSENPNGYGHYCLMVCIEGVQSSTGGPPAAGTPLVEVEMKMHYECQPNPANAILTFAQNTMAHNPDFCSPSPPYQPLLMAAADNISSEIPPIRCVDDAGVEELGFVKEVSRLWKNACAVATSVASVVNITTGVLAALAI